VRESILIYLVCLNCWFISAKDILDKLLLYLDDRVEMILNTCAVQLRNDEFYFIFVAYCCWGCFIFFSVVEMKCDAMIVVGIFSLNIFN
jgi:hypothetical protein